MNLPIKFNLKKVFRLANLFIHLLHLYSSSFSINKIAKEFTVASCNISVFMKVVASIGSFAYIQEIIIWL